MQNDLQAEIATNVESFPFILSSEAAPETIQYAYSSFHWPVQFSSASSRDAGTSAVLSLAAKGRAASVRTVVGLTEAGVEGSSLPGKKVETGLRNFRKTSGSVDSGRH